MKAGQRFRFLIEADVVDPGPPVRVKDSATGAEVTLPYVVAAHQAEPASWPPQPGDLWQAMDEEYPRVCLLDAGHIQLVPVVIDGPVEVEPARVLAERALTLFHRP